MDVPLAYYGHLVLDAQNGWHATCGGGTISFESQAPLWEVSMMPFGTPDQEEASRHKTE
jgi:hypothetical protein